MSFSKILFNKTIYSLRICHKNHQNFKLISNFSLNVKSFHSLNSFPKTTHLIENKLTLKTNICYRTLSSIKTDTTVDFKPDPNVVFDDNVIDLSNAMDTSLPSILNTVDSPVSSLGLASNYSPIGWVLNILDVLHSVMPWYATIAVATLCLRIAIFPLVIKAQRNAMKMNQILPQMQELQQKSTNARLSGNQLEFAKYLSEQQRLFKDNGISPMKNFLVPMAQAPIFVTFFLSLRRMAHLPVESLKTGGILWFVDLTVADPYHLLPIITSLSLWAALELGVESGVSTNQSAFVRMAVRAIPVVTLLFIWNFEAAILMYWCTSNVVSLLQVSLLKQTPIRKFLNIPARIKYNPSELPVQKKGFYESIKESMDNSKVYKKIEERKRIDEINFKKAAIGPIKKSYKTNPMITNTKLENRN